MTASLRVVFTEGTHRAAAPADTLARIAPLLPAMGITRAADITGLDRLGIPTWCAMRPGARQVQVSNGKGLSCDAAKVSALMEAIEHWHAENPAQEFRHASAAELEREGEAYVPASALPDWEPGLFLTDRRMVEWIRGEALADGAPVWLPACTAYLVEPMLVRYSTNGLASGNHRVEATLHALYEVIERDAVARLRRGGLSLPCGQSRVVDLDTVPAGPVAELRDRLSRAGIGVTLIRVDSVVPVSTFWAVLLDPAAAFACSFVNLGHGSHLSPSVAAIRAITEAAQSRLTFIHGAREDLRPEAYQFSEAHQRLRVFFERQRGDLSWSAVVDRSSRDLTRDLETILGDFLAAGCEKVYRVDLTNPKFDIPVVKVFVPGLASPGHLEG